MIIWSRNKGIILFQPRKEKGYLRECISHNMGHVYVFFMCFFLFFDDFEFDDETCNIVMYDEGERNQEGELQSPQ